MEIASAADDELYVAAPLATQFVRVQVDLVDGTSDARTWSVAEVGVEK